VAHAYAKHYGKQLHVYNASSKATRGIEFVEKDLTPLARSGMECIILLDEADQITKSAQMALKGVLENCSCIFILTCNNTSGLIEPLHSRCISFSFKPIDDDDAKNALQNIMLKEEINVSDYILTTIINSNAGDLRSMVNALQGYCAVLRHDGKGEALAFIERMDGSFSCGAFFELVNDKDFRRSLTMLEKSDDLRNTLNILMIHMINKNANMAVVSHIVTAFRDLQFGMPELIVRVGFCKNMVQSAPLIV
tara:strand:+ start:2129 stop:2881 length:753 start_codon:yes stop_codon:yes gene_type:complete